jgi:biotin carboxyl carrier protein
MSTRVTVGGQTRTITVQPIGAAGRRGGRFRLQIQTVGADGTAEVASCEVDARQTGTGLSIVYLSDGRVIDAAVTPGAGGTWLVQLPSVDVDVAVHGSQARPAGRGPGVVTSGDGRITAPMPGRVVRVLVRPGDQVEVRQGLVVVEAMKMENELTSPRAGRVAEVHVVEGVSVEAGRLLAVIE